jgi:hypothetical protein
MLTGSNQNIIGSALFVVCVLSSTCAIGIKAVTRTRLECNISHGVLDVLRLNSIIKISVFIKIDFIAVFRIKMGDLAIPAKPPKLKLIPVFWISMYRANDAVKSAATVFSN